MPTGTNWRVGRLRVGRGAARAEDAQGKPTQSRISPSILVHEDNKAALVHLEWLDPKPETRNPKPETRNTQASFSSSLLSLQVLEGP